MSSSRVEALQTKIQKASEGHYYIHVSRKDGKIKTSHIKLSGCDQMFKKDPAFMYVSSLRHAGCSTDLIEYLVDNGCDDAQVRGYLADAYTATNVHHRNAEITAEINGMPSVKKEKKDVVALGDIAKLRSVLEGFKVASGKTKEEEPKMVTPKVRTSRTDLASRLSGLEEDKVLDISNFDTNKNTGVKTTKRTTKGSRRPLAATGDLNKVVFDFNKSTDVAVAALVSMGFTVEKATSVMDAAQVSKPAAPELTKLVLTK
jgi:hypothetical protein